MIDLQNSSFFVTEFSCIGGTSFDRQTLSEDESDDRLTVQSTVVKTVDSVLLAKEARALISKAYALMDARCAKTAIGFAAPETPEGVAELLEKFAELSQEAENFNLKSEASGSARRVRLGLHRVQVHAESLESSAKRLQENLGEGLRAVKQALTDPEANWYATWRSSRNLPTLALGTHRDVVFSALESAKEIHKNILKRVRGGESHEQAVAVQDFSALDSAVYLTETAETPELDASIEE